MSRSEQDRFTDILHAIERCQDYTSIRDIVDNQLGPLADRLRQL